MTVCSNCKHANYCEIVAGGYSSQVKSCRDYRKGTITNEEWFATLSTEEKAECITNISFNTGYDSYDVVYLKIAEWLKQPHRNE